MRACQVSSEAEFALESNSTAGDDVYLCRYSWHDERRQFTRLTAGGLRGRGKRGERGGWGEEDEDGMVSLFEECSEMEGCGGDSESDSDASFHAGGVESESEEEREGEDDLEEEDGEGEGEGDDGYGSDGGSHSKRRGKKIKGRSRKKPAKKQGSAPTRSRVRARRIQVDGATHA